MYCPHCYYLILSFVFCTIDDASNKDCHDITKNPYFRNLKRECIRWRFSKYSVYWHSRRIKKNHIIFIGIFERYCGTIFVQGAQCSWVVKVWLNFVGYWFIALQSKIIHYCVKHYGDVLSWVSVTHKIYWSLMPKNNDGFHRTRKNGLSV